MAGDLSVTALYTSQVWAWGGLAGAELFATVDGKRVFDVTNAALGAASVLKSDAVPLRYALLHRHAMIDHLLRGAPAPEVLELAAGLSRRGAAFSADPARHYTEVDLPPVIARKRELLARTAAGQAVLARPNLALVGADVETAALATWRTPGTPLFVIAEGLAQCTCRPRRSGSCGPASPRSATCASSSISCRGASSRRRARSARRSTGR